MLFDINKLNCKNIYNIILLKKYIINDIRLCIFSIEYNNYNIEIYSIREDLYNSLVSNFNYYTFKNDINKVDTLIYTNYY